MKVELLPTSLHISRLSFVKGNRGLGSFFINAGVFSSKYYFISCIILPINVYVINYFISD